MLLSLMSSSVIKSICRLFQICDHITLGILTLIMCFKTFLYKERVCCFYVSYDVQYHNFVVKILNQKKAMTASILALAENLKLSCWEVTRLHGFLVGSGLMNS